MYPVCEHLLARRNKRAPFRDKRRIVLALPGGLMWGIRGGATMIAFQELGLASAFDDIYAVSAGFCNASYLLARQAPLGNSIYYQNLRTKKFINYFRPWKIADMDYVLRIVRTVKKLNVPKILSQKTRLWVRLYDLGSRKHKFLEVHRVNLDGYFSLLKAAISVAYLVPGAITIGSRKYKDSDFRPADHIKFLREVLSRPGTDFLVVYNDFSQYEYVHSRMKNFQRNGKTILEIYPKQEWKLSRFETDPAKLKLAARQMGRLVKREFGWRARIKLY